MKQVIADIMPLSSLSLEDTKKFIMWAWESREKTKFEPEIMNHTRMCISRAMVEGDPKMYIPIQPVLMFDALVSDPELTDRKRALCMGRIGEQLDKVQQDTGMMDAYFTCNDEREVDTCCNHGWTRVMHDPLKNLWLLRKRATREEPKAQIEEDHNE